jgi:hypothetical protein
MKEKIRKSEASLFVLITLHCFPNRVLEGVVGEASRIHAGDAECIQNFTEFSLGFISTFNAAGTLG